MRLVDGIWLPANDTYFAKYVVTGWERDKLDAALSCVKNHRTCIDCGAHVGLYTMPLASIFKTVNAFEPSLPNFDCLRENTRGMSTVHAIYAALGADFGRADIILDAARKGNTGSNYIGLSNTGAVVVDKLDTYNFKDVDFIKMDLEGFEYYALLGAAQTISKYKPVIMLEEKDFKGRYKIETNAATTLLLKMGYELRKSIKRDHIFTYGG